jgi:uncharacterized protein YbgA (DUF1722 family)/uncharacterized protein YbbK (DUF523 family)
MIRTAATAMIMEHMAHTDGNMDPRILVGVSTCLLGEKVRWDAGHKHDRYLTDILGRYFEFVPACPEADIGMGIPREPVHLRGDPSAPRMLGNRTGEDWTDRMNSYSRRKVEELSRMGLSGYVLKRASPSCGMERVPVKGEPGPGGDMPRRLGAGLFAAELMRRLPLLPVEEEGRLNDPGLRENFIVRVFAYHRVQQLFAGGASRGDIVAFHTRQKLLLMAHSPRHYRELGRLVADVAGRDADDLRLQYVTGFMEALQLRATTRKHVNVLQHLIGYLKDRIGAAEKADILHVIEQYRAGTLPLIVPLTLIAHYLKVHGITYLLEQEYLQPAPAELALRNHV